MISRLVAALRRRVRRTPDRAHCASCGTPVPKSVLEAYRDAITTGWRYCPACGEEWQSWQDWIHRHDDEDQDL